MSNSFDNKVYDFILSNSSDTFPVGTVIRKTSREPPTPGTWKIIGVYGTKSFYEVSTNKVGVTHNMVFNGTTITDCFATDFTTYETVNYNYTSHFDNYSLQFPMLITNQSMQGFSGDLVNSIGQKVGITVTGNSVSISKASGTSYSIVGSLIIMLQTSTETFQGTIFDGLIFEFERTA